MQSWNAFEDSKREQIIENTVNSEPVATLHTSDANQHLGFSNYEVAISPC